MGSRADAPVFVVGCARSGTTLLQLMLHAHPNLAVPAETRYLVRAYDRREEFGDLRDPASVDALVDLILEDRKIRDLGIDVDELRARAHEVEPTVGTILALPPLLYAERHGARRWGDKRPGYFKRLDAILDMHPDAQIVHLIRDGRDCVASLKRMRWWSSGSIGAMQNWVDAIRTGNRARRRMPADRFIEVRYEDLVARPEAELRRLCDFLGEPFDEAMLTPGDVADVGVPARKRRKHHRRTTQPVDERAVGRFASGLEPWELRLMEAVAGRLLRQHGYELSTGRRPAPPLARGTLAYLRRRMRLLPRRRRAAREYRQRRRRYPYVAARR